MRRGSADGESGISWLGVMGFPMAGHLAAKGHEVTVWNRSPAKAEAWVARKSTAGARRHPARGGEGAEFVMACVGNDDDLRSGLPWPEDGAFAGMGRGAIFVDHTTVSAKVTRELAEVAAARGLGFVDAPVSGGQAGAENGQLSIMCGGDRRRLCRAEPVMAAYARICRLMGPSRGRATGQDDEPDLHRGPDAGPVRGAGLWPEGRA
jgi:3-hydroxyisobutyrate dehydrogenase